MLLLSMHRIARHGDGLAPELITLVGQRSALGATANVINLREFNPAIPHAAGLSTYASSRNGAKDFGRKRPKSERR